jgi:uncharacterized protein RhaS with RHS repeats
MTYTHFGAVLTQQTRGQSAVNNDLTTYTYYDASKYFQKASVTDPNGKTTTFDYYGTTDGDTTTGNKGEVRWVRDAGYTVSTSPSYHKEYDYTYNSNGQKATGTNLNGVVTQYSYGDSWGNLTQVVQDYGTGKINRTTSMVYDIYGRVQSSTDPMSQVSSFTYYSLGQPSTASFPARGGAPSETITYTYEGNGRTKAVTDNRGTTTLNYENGCDRVASVTDPVTGTVSYTYLPSGERATVTLPDLTTTTYNYHATNIMLPKDDPNAVSRLLVNITDNDGRKVDLHYKDSFAGTNTLGVVDYVRWNQVYSGSTLVSYCQATYTLYIDGGASDVPAYTRRGQFGPCPSPDFVS